MDAGTITYGTGLVVQLMLYLLLAQTAESVIK